jgi:hypothetical protein
MIDALDAVGIRATMDPRKVQAPCALITPPDLERKVGCADPWAAWTVWLLAPAPADLDAVKWLLDHVTDAFDAVGGFTAEFSSVTLNPDADPLPGYQITVITQPM